MWIVERLHCFDPSRRLLETGGGWATHYGTTRLQNHSRQRTCSILHILLNVVIGDLGGGRVPYPPSSSHKNFRA